MPRAFWLRDFYFQDSTLMIECVEKASSYPVRTAQPRSWLSDDHKGCEP
jgi:hypothetical protein